MSDLPKENHSDSNKKLARHYDNALARIEKRLAEAEHNTLETLEKEIRDAVEFEQDLERLTKDEVSLLTVWLNRDLQDLGHFVSSTGRGLGEWLNIDLSTLELSLARALQSVADKTRIDQLELAQKLESDPGTYIEGELATAGTFSCTECDKIVVVTHTRPIERCHRCDNHIFHRVSQFHGH
ncbi:zinc ribbon-containing protein [Oceanospirillum linum]|uniref:Metalloendopeptidase n=1 Tax=Oceanospirillum linum TaxID=966 RepID=A0A1T1HA33_OCELI|nr:zinc ribbon-containing protein [Oceanospirillum linum]OOV86724.1 hypothetical protein BTA35_0211705 [Oceanospirillum linum]SEG29656.1 Zinc-ribbon containing domain-containing protein [Oleiphilus messinensis]SMP26247.1 Zinc-ribbon containing domain-containing protein [Oceanospirillum linum]